MRMSHTNYKNVIKDLGGDPMRFLLLLVHTLNVLSMNLLQVKGLFFDLSMSHCNKRYRSEEISPPVIIPIYIVIRIPPHSFFKGLISNLKKSKNDGAHLQRQGTFVFQLQYLGKVFPKWRHFVLHCF